MQTDRESVLARNQPMDHHRILLVHLDQVERNRKSGNYKKSQNEF